MAEVEIIGAALSNYVWVCRIACEEKGVPYKLTSVMPHAPEANAIHPLGKIPAMRHGEVTLCESRAICSYIDHSFDGPPLTPRDPVAAAKVEQWISIVNTAFDPVAVRQYLGGYFFSGLPDGAPDRKRIEGALEKMETQIGVLDQAVAETGHLVGKDFTLADMNVIPILYYLQELPESIRMLGKAKSLKAYIERHMTRKSVIATTPPPPPKK